MNKKQTQYDNYTTVAYHFKKLEEHYKKKDLKKTCKREEHSNDKENQESTTKQKLEPIKVKLLLYPFDLTSC